MSTFVTKVVHPMMEMVERRRFRSVFHWFKHCESLPAHELRRRQEEKMRELIRHSYANVPFYKERFDSLGIGPDRIATIDDLSMLPILRKDELRERFPIKVTAGNVPRRRRIFDRTSGSTGEPLAFYRDKKSRDHTLASFLLFNHWAGIEPGERSVHVGAAAKFSLRVFASNLLQRHSDISVFDLTADKTRQILVRLARTRPVLIEGYASGIFRLAEAALDHGISIRPKAVVVTSDTLPSAKPLEQAFHCPIFNRYGNRELCGALGQNCPEGRSLHINSELCILEVVDEQGRPVGRGQKGKILLTDLLNYVMPLIRYDTGDLAIDGGQCTCGRGFPLLSSIEGRRSECLISPHGRVITPVALGHYLFVLHEYIDRFSKYQAEQTDSDRVIFRFVPRKSFNEKTGQKLKKDLQQLMGNGVAIDLELTEDILPEPSGKRLIIKSLL